MTGRADANRGIHPRTQDSHSQSTRTNRMSHLRGCRHDLSGEPQTPARTGQVSVVPGGSTRARYYVLADAFTHTCIRPTVTAETNPLFTRPENRDHGRKDLPRQTRQFLNQSQNVPVLKF
ncbi:hypothetical protein E2C01_003749 [Portunus trituberculatus]|uniref:Uncharacterized protein n=1 Tax=Portunus trituberculatus TaxID=210409 RepID=A0A5B7CS25_PORTR|nr:hypothetical protein [Portunus trituberculatus]